MRPVNEHQAIIVTIILIVTAAAIYGNTTGYATQASMSAISLWAITVLALSLLARKAPRTPNFTMVFLLLIALCALISSFLIGASAQPLFSGKADAQQALPASLLSTGFEISSLQ